MIFWKRIQIQLKNHFTEFILLALYSIFFIRFFAKIHTGLLENLSIITFVASFASIYSVKYILSASFFKLPKLRTITEIVFLLLYSLLTLYHFRMGVGIDYSILRDNSDIAVNADSIMLVLRIFKKQDYLTILFLLMILIFFELKHKLISSKKRNFSIIKYLIGIAVIIFFSTVSISTFDCFSIFGKSVYRYYFNNPITYYDTKQTTKYPLLNNFIATSANSKPNVIIVMIESFNPNFVDKKTKEGMELMPFFNDLKTKGQYYTNFWGHSIQTAKGQFGILCSLTPVTRKKVFTDYVSTKFNCLPEILKKNGYYTFFFKGYDKINFDNTYQFTTKNGFMYSRGQDEKLVSKKEREKVSFNWGIRDDVTYKNFFNEIDLIHQKHEGPIFASVTSLTTHSPFEVPKEDEVVFKNPKNRYEAYNNSIILADRALKIFFEEFNKREYLKNSVIFITGDHGYPLGEHGVYYQSSNAYEENFRTPLLIYSKTDKRFQSKIIETPRSHQDIAPTILDLAGISTKTHFIGTSLFSKEPEYIHLIQPYAGRYVGVVHYPLKYILHIATMKEYLFNLQLDPMEKTNILHQYQNSETHLGFKKEVGKIFFYEELIKANRVWSNQ